MAAVIHGVVGAGMSPAHIALGRPRGTLASLLGLLVVMLSTTGQTAMAWSQGSTFTVRARVLLASRTAQGSPSGLPLTSSPPVPEEVHHPEFRPYIRQLREVFGYQTYDHVDELLARLPLGGTQRFPLPGGRELEIRLVGIRGPMVRVEVKIWRAGLQELTTLLAVPPDRPALIGGPPYGAGVLIIAITTRRE